VLVFIARFQIKVHFHIPSHAFRLFPVTLDRPCNNLRILLETVRSWVKFYSHAGRLTYMTTRQFKYDNSYIYSQ